METLLLAVFKQVAKDYNLSFKDLRSRYLEPSELVVLPLSKMKKEDFIKELEDNDVDTSEMTVAKLKDMVKDIRVQNGVKPAKTGGRKKKAVKEIPVHNHPVCDFIVESCKLCCSHGNILNRNTIEEIERVV